jgi:hypothetical protein
MIAETLYWLITQVEHNTSIGNCIELKKNSRNIIVHNLFVKS